MSIIFSNLYQVGLIRLCELQCCLPLPSLPVCSYRSIWALGLEEE